MTADIADIAPMLSLIPRTYGVHSQSVTPAEKGKGIIISEV